VGVVVVWRVSAFARAAAFQADRAEVSPAQLRAAAEVLDAIARVDLGPLEQAATADPDGNPVLAMADTQQEAWATYLHAMETRDRAAAWAEMLMQASLRR
jgi:cell division septation protein DedD